MGFIILHNRQDAASRAFVASASGQGHTIIEWYTDSQAVAQYLADHPGMYPSAFPSVVIRRPDVEVPESTHEITGEVIPAHVVPAHWELVRCPSGLEELADLHDPYYGLTLDEAKALKRDEAKAAMDSYIAAIQPEYGQYSMATWDVQAAEAEALLAGTITEAQCPGLAQLVAGRVASGGADLTITEQAERIRANRAAWRSIGLYVEGQRNGYMDRIQAAQDVAAVAAIAVAYSLPQGA
jgi:hypothetical protein